MSALLMSPGNPAKPLTCKSVERSSSTIYDGRREASTVSKWDGGGNGGDALTRVVPPLVGSQCGLRFVNRTWNIAVKRLTCAMCNNMTLHYCALAIDRKKCATCGWIPTKNAKMRANFVDYASIIKPLRSAEGCTCSQGRARCSSCYRKTVHAFFSQHKMNKR